MGALVVVVPAMSQPGAIRLVRFNCFSALRIALRTHPPTPLSTLGSIIVPDRTRPMAYHSQPDRAPRLEWLIFAIFALNVIDAVATIIWVSTDLMSETNPLMAPLLNRHPLVFYGTKIGLVALGSALLWRLREHRAAVFGIGLLFAVYYLLLLAHLATSSVIWGELLT